MSGINAVMNIAKDAIAAQQLGLQVTSHNIANVNTDSYSRQYIPYTARDPVPYGGLLMGMGVDVQQVSRNYDDLLEKQLLGYKTDLSAYEESESYIKIMESLFNENSDSSLSNTISDFWNSWYELSNSPTGASERVQIYDTGQKISEQLNFLNTNLFNIQVSLDNEIEAAISNINTMTSELADINGDIVANEVGRTANDLRDRRQGLLTDLSKLIDTYSFEQPNGTLTVTTANGFVLVNGVDNYELKNSGDAILWQGSGTSEADITDKISSGKIGGWLDLRDEVVNKYQRELDVLSKEMIWNVNYQHSQGVGLEYFDASQEGTYAVDESGLLSTLAFGNKIDYTKDFKMWTKDVSGQSPDYTQLDIDMGLSTAKTALLGNGSANHTYRFTVATGGTVNAGGVVGGVTPVINWEKIDSSTGLVTGNGTFNITNLGAMPPAGFDGGALQLNIGAAANGLATFVEGNTMTINMDDTAPPVADPLVMNATGSANSILDTYTFRVKSGGTIGTDDVEIEWFNSHENGTFTLKGLPIPDTTEDVDGMTLSFPSGTVFDGDVWTLETDDAGKASVNLPSDWHWTMDSFITRFNDKADMIGAGVRAYETADHRLTFSEYTDGNKISYVDTSGTIPFDATVLVNDYTKLTVQTPSPPGTTPLRFSWNGAGWNIVNNPGYGAMAVTGSANRINVDLDGDAVNDITIRLDNPALTAGDYVQFDIVKDPGEYQIAFGNDEFDDSGLTAALGINTFFTGSDSNGIAVNQVLADEKYVAAAQINAPENDQIKSDTAVTFPIQIALGVNDQIVFDETVKGETIGPITATIAAGNYNTEGDLHVLAKNIETALETASSTNGYNINYDVTYDTTNKAFVITEDSGRFLDEMRIEWQNSNSASDLGFKAELDTYTQATGDYGANDNTNALKITDVQSQNLTFAEWDFDRGKIASSSALTGTLEDFYHSMVGSMGIRSQSIQRAKSFNEIMTTNLGEQRDSISGVSLDEEMVNMIKFQQAYTVASKLLTVADEMLNSLISAR